MQIIGRNLPQLQNVVTSGLDSVTQGLVQNSSAVAAQGLAVIKDSFVAAGLNATTLNPTSSVQSEAGFQSPGTYFNQAGPELSEKFAAMSAALNNQNLRPESVIGNFAGSLGDLNSKIGSFADSPGTQQGIIIIGGRFQPGPPPIMPEPPPIEPMFNQAPGPPPIRELGPNPPPIRTFTPGPPPILPQVAQPEPPPIREFSPTPPPIDVLNSDGPPIRLSPSPPPIMPTTVFGPEPPPIVPQILMPNPPPIAPEMSSIPQPPPIRELIPNPPPIDVLAPDGPPILPSPPLITPADLAILGPQPPPIKIGDQFGPSPPPIMPNDIFQSQLQTLRDMETTVGQSTNLYQQLNASMFNRNI